LLIYCTFEDVVIVFDHSATNMRSRGHAPYLFPGWSIYLYL